MLNVTILLLRHAAHVHLDRRLSGRLPGVGLSEEGQDQAARLAAFLAHEPITRVECSPLERTMETAAALAAACALPPPSPIEALIEIDMGDWTGSTFENLAGSPDWDAWNTRRGTARIPGGETMSAAQARIAGHMRATVAGARADEVIAMVTHSDMIRAAVAHVLGLPLDNLLRFDIGPASVTRIVMGAWGARLVSLNEKVW